MAHGAQENGANGPTRTDRPPLRQRPHSQPLPNESSKEQQVQQPNQPSHQPDNESSKAPQQQLPPVRFRRVRSAYKTLRQRLQRLADVLLLDYGFAKRPLTLRLSQAARRLGRSLQSVLQQLQQHLRSMQVREKFFLALQLSRLFLLLVLTVGGSGARKIALRLLGPINRLRQILGWKNLQRITTGLINRLRAIAGQIKQSLQRAWQEAA